VTRPVYGYVLSTDQKVGFESLSATQTPLRDQAADLVNCIRCIVTGGDDGRDASRPLDLRR
jgi:hypothetical protein